MAGESRAPDREPLDAAAMVGTLLDVAPGQEFVLRRFRGDGEPVDVRVRVQLLRTDENHAALIAAQKYAQERGELKGYGDVYREAQAVEVLVRAVRHPTKQTREDGTQHYRPLYVSAAQLRQSLTEPEMARLLNAYEIVKSKFGDFEALSDDQLDAVIEKLANGFTGPHFLARLDSARWPDLMMAMARRAEQHRAAFRTLSGSLSGSESDPETSDGGTTPPSGEPSDASTALLTPDGSPAPSLPRRDEWALSADGDDSDA